MEFDRRTSYASTASAATHDAPAPGKQTLTQDMVQLHPAAAPSSAQEEPASAPPLPVPTSPRPTIQMLFGQRGSAQHAEQVHAAATRGTATAATQLPHLEQIQRSFGKHDVSAVQAHAGGEAAASAHEMGAAAYATGNHVVLGSGTDLHTVAHEAAHVVQQREGVQLKGGVGEVGDAYERQADEVADAVVAGRSAEPLLDKFASAGGEPAVQRAGAGMIQRSIGCHQTAAGADQFQIDAVRPAWDAFANAIALAAGQDRCHIIAFEVIQNDLANILNDMLNSRGTVNFFPNVARLQNLCNSLYTTAGTPQQLTMAANLAAMIAGVGAIPAGALTAAQRTTLTNLSGALLSSLNSCTDNLRAGDSGLNTSIGYSTDAEFQPGTVWYHGPIQVHGAAPAVGAPPAGTVPMGPGAGAAGAVGPFEAVRLTAAHEARMYQYQSISTLALSFVVSGGGGALYPGTTAGQQLSSTQMPTASGHPVIVMDPAGAGLPMVFRG